MKKDLLKIIKTEEQYEKVIRRIDELMLEDSSEESDNEMMILFLLVKEYEDRYYEVEKPSLTQSILFRLDQMNYYVEGIKNIFNNMLGYLGIRRS